MNKYYRHVGARVLVSAAGRRYRAAVLACVLAAGPPPRLAGPLAVRLEIRPPAGRQAQDVDNSLKALLDALQAAGVYGNDRQICRLEASRLAPAAPGGVRATIAELEDPA